LVTPKNFRIWSENPPYRRRMTGCFQDMHNTSHSQSSSLTNVNWRLGVTLTTKGAWSGTQTVPKPIMALVPECVDGAQEGGTVAVLGSTTQYSKLKYMSLRLA